MPWKENTDYRHGLIAYNWLEQYNNKTVNAIEIRTCIRYHMGRWCSPKEEIERAIKPNTNELIVQLADYMSSRKNVSFLPGISLSEDSIRNYSAT